MSTSKIYLHVGPFSLKRNWRLAERLLNTWGFKQDPQVVREEGRKIHQVGIYGSGRGIRGKGRLPGQRPALGSEQFQPQLGYPSPGILQRRWVPGLAWGWLDYKGVWGNLEWHLGGAEAATTDTYTRSTSGKSRTLTAVSPHHPPSQESTRPQLLHSRAEDAEACEGVGSDQLWETRETWTWDCVPWERVTIAGTWQAVWRRQLKPPSAADTSKGPPLLQHHPPPPLWGKHPRAGTGKALTLRGMGSGPSRPYGLLLQHLGTDSAPAEQGWLLNRGETPPHTGSSSSPSACSPTSYQDDSGQHILKKDVTGVQIKSSPPAKTRATHSLRRNAPI